MKTTNSLPKYWVVQCTTNNPNWKKVIDYLKDVHGEEWEGDVDGAYYGYDGSSRWKGTNTYYTISEFRNSPVVLTIEEFVEMTEGFVLPEKWCIKRDKENDKIVTDFINNYSESNHCYLDYNPKNPYLHYAKEIVLSNDKPWDNYTEITFEQFKKYILKPEETMKNKTITWSQAQQIIDAACRPWKDKLFNKWGREIVLKESIGISGKFYQTMRKACTSEQHQLFDEIFGKDEPSFKIGDWIMFEGGNTGPHQIKSFTSNGGALDQDGQFRDIQLSQYRLATEEEIQKAKYIPKGTPCLVRDSNNDMWKLTYSLGNGKFQSRSGVELSWVQVQVLDINNLPKY